MAAGEIKIAVVLNDNGTIALTTRSANKLKKELDAIGASAAQTSKALNVAKMRTQGTGGIQENIDYRNARGVAGTAGGGARDFAKQAQGLGGLVRLYATFAANIFAVSSAFMALDKAAQFTQMIEGAKALEASTGAALRNIADQMKNVTDGALSMQESMRLTALGSAAGLSQKKILELTKGAKGASLALGRDMSDSIDRVIRGVAKLEPELLDELGVVTRAQEAYKNYAKSINVSTDSLTSYQKTMAYSSAVADELTNKFGSIADKVPANPYAKFLGQLKDVGTELINLVNKVVTPVITVFSNNIELMFAGVLLLVKSLTLRALPEISKLFIVPQSVIEERQSQNLAMVQAIKEANEAELVSARRKTAELIKLEKQKTDEIIGIKRAETFNLSKNVLSPKSITAKAIESGEDLNARQIAVLKGTLTKTTKAITEAEKTGSGVSSEQITLLKAKEQSLNKILTITAENNALDIESSKTIDRLKGQQENIEKSISMQKSAQNKLSLAEIDLAKDKLAILKLEKISEVEKAKYYNDAVYAKKVELEYQEKIKLARRESLIAQGYTKPKEMGPNNIPILSAGNTLSKGGERLAKLGDITDTVKDKVNSLGKGISKIVGFLGTWGIGAMIAYEALSFVANAVGLLNKKDEELNKTLEEGNKVLETATSAYYEYSLATVKGTASSSALIQANKIAANTFEQVDSSISTSLNTFNEWQKASTGWSRFWDNFFPGKSRFDSLKTLMSEQLAAAAKMATGFEKIQLESLSKRVSGTTQEEGLIALNKIQEESSALLQRSAEVKKIESSRIEDLTKKYGDAANALENFNKKQLIKNQDLRTIDETLDALSKFMTSTATESAKLQMIAGLPEEIAKLDAVLAKSRQDAIDELTSRRNFAEVQANLLKEQKVQEDHYKLSRTELNLLDATSTEELIARKEAASKDTGRLEEGALRARFEKESKYIEERIAKENAAKEAFEKSMAAQKLKDDEVRNATLKNLGYDMGKEMVKGWLDFLPDSLRNLLGKPNTPNITAPPAAKLAAENAVLKSKNQIPNYNIGMANTLPGGKIKARGDLGTRTYDSNAAAVDIDSINKGIEQAKAVNAAKDKKNKRESYALEKENIALQQTTIQLKLKQLDIDDTIAKKTKGYISDTSIADRQKNENQLADLKYEDDKIDIKKKYAKEVEDGLISLKQANNLQNQAMKNAEKEKDTAYAVAKAKAEQLKIERALADYKINTGDGLDRQVALERASISQNKELGNLSAQETADQTYALDVRGLLNKFAEDSIVLEETALENAGKKLLNDLAILKISKETTDQLETRAALQRKFNSEQESTQQKIDAGLRNNISTVQLEVDLIQQKIAETERLNSIDYKDGKALERNLALNKEILSSLERQHEAKKRDFMNQEDKGQIIYDEAAKRAREFAASLKDTVTGTFDAVYSGMDAAIDAITTKMMEDTKISFVEIRDLFRNTVAEGFRSMAAEQMKSNARNIIKDIMGAVIPGVDLSTNEEKALDYAKRTAEATERLAGTGTGGMAKGLLGFFGKDTSDMSGQGAFSALSLNDKLALNTGFNMNSVEDNLENAQTSAEYFSQATDEAGNSLSTLAEEVPGFMDKLGTSFSGLFGTDGFIMGLIGKLGKGIGGLLSPILNLFGISGIGGSTGSLGGFNLGSLTSLFSGDGIGSAIGSALGMEGFGGWLSGLFFANGGIMTDRGALSLNKYATGGVANSPQLAMYGEGRQPEAYVPLPDGRTIPVTMQGNRSGGDNISFNIVINDNSTVSTTQEGETNNKDRQQGLAQFSSLITQKVREEMVNQKRPGGLLYGR